MYLRAFKRLVALSKVNIPMGPVIVAPICGSSLFPPVQCGVESRINDSVCNVSAVHCST